jgi:energy-coupling factor transporter ATP-binding protein EcfA2
VSEEDASPIKRPSLRIAELTIENFRTFQERTVIPFSSDAGEADAIATFHGDNGSGKSNAIAALKLVLRALTFLAEQNRVSCECKWDTLYPTSAGFLFLSSRDRPSDLPGPVEIAVRFADPQLGTLKILVARAGSNVKLEVVDPAGRLPWSDALRTWLETPFGPRSRPIAVLHAHRRASWFTDQTPGETIQPALAEALLEARLSRDPERRARWRDFEAALLAVPAFSGMDISIDRTQMNGLAELTFERRGKLVLGLEELSSGERQLVVLFAGVLLAEAAIVAVEEPELSLDAMSQRHFYDFLARLVEKRRIDQAIIESHVAAFDGPHVVRFHRDPGGATKVTREVTASPEAIELAQRATEHGAKQRWVTGEGFTQLPDAMRDELQVGAGKHVWFLRGPERWEAWPEDELDRMLGGSEDGGHG